MVTIPSTRGAQRPTPSGYSAINAPAVIDDGREALGRGLEQAGDAVYKVQQDNEIARITEVELRVSQQLDDLLYNPDTGYLATAGKDAVAAREARKADLKRIRDEAVKGLTESEKQRLAPALFTRFQGTVNTMDRHALGQNQAWKTDTSIARAALARNDALQYPDQLDTSLGVMLNEIAHRGSIEGWSAERVALEQQTATSDLYRENIERVAVVDPGRAIDMLNSNRDNLTAIDRNDLEATLVPEAKRRLGRERGRQVYQSQETDFNALPIGFDWTRHTIHGGTRPDAITGMDQGFAIGIAHMIDQAPPEIRDGLQVFSGYRSVEKQAELWQAALRKYGSPEVARKWVAPPGSSQHNHGNAADLMWNGQRLDKAPEYVREWVHQNAARFGLHFPLGNEAWHVEKAGTRGTTPFAPTGQTLSDLLDIEDPLEREAAINEFELMSAAAAKASKQRLEIAQDAVFQAIEAGESVNSLPLAVRQELGQTALTSLREYEKKITAGETIETDPSVYYELRELLAQSPNEFRQLNLLEYRDQLSETDFKGFVDKQTTPESQSSARAASTLMSTAKRHLENAGIGTTQSANEGDRQTNARVQTELLNWQDAFIQENRRVPTHKELDTEIRSMLTDVLIDPRGPFNQSETLAVSVPDMDLSPEDLVDSTIEIGGQEVPPAVVAEVISELQARNEEVTARAVTDFLLDAMTEAGIQ